MRLLSVRLIVSLIVGITLVSLGFSYYEVVGEKRALRSDLERRAEILRQKPSRAMWKDPGRRDRSGDCNGSFSGSAITNI